MPERLLSSLRTVGTGRFRPLFTLALWYASLGLLLRIVLWVAFGRAQQVHVFGMAGLLLSGVIADLIESFYLLAPFALFLWLTPDSFYRRPTVRRVLLGGAFVWMFAFTFVAAIEYFFFEEFDARLNLVAVDYLLYPTEVVGDIWADYPVATVAVLVGLVSAGVVYALRRTRVPATEVVTRFAQRTAVFVLFIVLTVLFALWFETYDLSFSSNRVAMKSRRMDRAASSVPCARVRSTITRTTRAVRAQTI